MQIECDPDKDRENRKKHGISLRAAERIDWQRLIQRIDDRLDYGEVRYIGAAPLNGRLHVVIYTPRPKVLRIISLRKANHREVREYEKAIQKS